MNDELFLSKEPYGDVTKVATTTLSRDGDKWEQDILQTLHKEHPYIAEHDIQVQLSKTDPENGAGVGAIRLDDRVVIPIIIDKFRLAPLDLYWFENELHPLTRGSFEAVMQNTDVGTPVDPGQGEAVDASLYGKTQPPFDGKYTYAALASIAGPDRLAEALTASFSDDGLRYELGTNPAFATVVKDALTRPVEKTAAAPVAKTKLTVKTAKAFQAVKTAGVYEIAAGGRLFPALVFDRVLSLGGDRPLTKVAMAVELGPEARYALWSDDAVVGGRELSADHELPQDEPRSGDRGVFYKIAADGFTCTDPLTIDCRLDHGWAACDAFGRSFRLRKTAGVKQPVVVDQHVTLPPSWRWMKLGAALRPMTPAAASALTLSRDGDSFSVLHHGGRFTVRGLPGFSGEGDDWDKTASVLEERFDGQDVAAALSVAQTAGAVHLCFRPEHRPTVKLAGRFATYRAPRLCKEAAFIRPLEAFVFDGGPRVLLKVAAIDDDKTRTTVDTLLGLGFITPENMPRFIDKLPQLEDAQKVIAKLLLASRIGLDVDSRPLRTAMFALDAVNRDLRELQNAAEVQEQES